MSMTITNWWKLVAEHMNHPTGCSIEHAMYMASLSKNIIWEWPCVDGKLHLEWQDYEKQLVEKTIGVIE